MLQGRDSPNLVFEDGEMLLPLSAVNSRVYRSSISSFLGVASRSARVNLLSCIAVLTIACGIAHAAPSRSSFQANQADSSGSHITVSGSMPKATVGENYNTVVNVSGGTAPYQFSIVYQSLPPGLSLNPNTGSITGKPTASGTYLFSVGATDLPHPDSGDHRFTIVVADQGHGKVKVQLTPSTATIDSGGTLQMTPSVTGSSNTAVTWATTLGTGSQGGMYQAPVVQETSTAIITVTSVADPTAKATAQITILPQGGQVSVQVSPTNATLTSGATQQFTATVTGTSQTGVTWTASQGTVSSSGLYTAPDVTSPTSATVTATSVADNTAKGTASVTINPNGNPGPPVITTSSLPPATSGSPYSATLAVSGGQPPFQWSITSGSLPSGLSLNSTSGAITGTTTKTGTFNFTVKVTDSTSQSDTQALSLVVSNQNTGGFDGPAELPRIFLQTALANTPAPGKTTTVNAGGDFQAALNSASCGDTIELQSGATFNGSFTLPAKGCDDQHWIIIRTSAPDSSLPAEGSRMKPCYAGVSSLPGRPAFNCSSNQNVLAHLNYTQTSGSGPIFFAPGATHYRLIGLEISRSSGTGYIGNLAGVSSGQADHIILDRVWMHGSTSDDTGRGLYLNGMSYTAAIDSYFSDFHCTSVVGACTDAQAISGGSGNYQDGPFKIVDNFLEASGECILFGGGAATTTPTDIEVRLNHFFKPLLWLSGQPGFIGGQGGNPFAVKNHFELKNAQRVLYEGNIAENTWGGFSQSGYSILLTPKNQNLNGVGVCPLCQVTDITIRYSTVSHVGSGITLANDLSTGAGGQALDGERYSIHDITVDDIDAVKYVGNGTLFLVLNAWDHNVPNNITINHITAFPDEVSGKLLSLENTTNNPTMQNFVFTNNMAGAGRYPVWSAGGGSTNCGYSDVPVTSIALCFNPYTFIDNAVIAATSAFPPSTWPSGNYFPSDFNSVGFANYNNGNGGDYHLTSSSPYKNAASDGKDVGADIDAIESLTSTVY